MASFLSNMSRRTLLSYALPSSPLSPSVVLRPFSSSSPALVRRSKLEEDIDLNELMEHIEEPEDTIDSPTVGHLQLQEQRIVRHYLNLIENEMPKLAALRKPFVAPTSKEPLIVRSMDYMGEEHPAQVKRSIVVVVDHLPLKDEMAKKKLILLAGPRWTPNPPVDAGVGKFADWGHGFLKIACEDYPQSAMNLKWISDTLDKLIEKANMTDENWESLPVDLRHVYAKAKKAKKGEHLRGRILTKPTFRDFPKEWLPKIPTSPQPVSPS